MRSRLVVMALAAFAALATTACTNAPGSGSTPTPTKAAKTVLEEAAAKSEGQSFKYTITWGDLLTGDGYQSADGTTVSRNVTVKDTSTGLTIKVAGLIFPDALFVKLDMGPLGAQIPGLAGLGDKWLVADKAKIGDKGMAAFLTSTESNQADAYVKGVVYGRAGQPDRDQGHDRPGQVRYALGVYGARMTFGERLRSRVLGRDQRWIDLALAGIVAVWFIDRAAHPRPARDRPRRDRR